MVYDSFKVLFNFVCKNFVEDFHFYVNQGYWTVILLPFSVRIWLWYQSSWPDKMSLEMFPRLKIFGRV